MRKYTDLSTTPMGFHRFYSVFILPIEAFMNATSFFLLLQDLGGGLTLSMAFSLILTVAFVFLAFYASRGLRHFQRKGLYALYGLLALQAGSNLWNGWMFYVAGDMQFVSAEILSVTVFLLIFLYYFRRKALFTPEGDVPYIKAQFEALMNEMAEAEEQATLIHEEEVVEEEEEIGEYDCPSCGRHITDGAVFCPRCGAQTRTVRR